MTMNHCWNLSERQLLLFCVTIVILKIASFDLCENGQVIHSDFKTAERACCVNVLCPSGTQPKICRKNEPSSTLCQDCHRGTFQLHSTNSSDMKHCEAKTTCYDNQVARFENSRKRDTVCECNTDLGYCNSVVHQHSRLPQCIKKKCGEGLHLALNCSCLSFTEVKKIGVAKPPSCNSSSSICRNKQNLTTDEIIKITYPEESQGVTEGNLPAIQTDQIHYTVNNSSYKDQQYSDSGSTIYFWFIVIPIVIGAVVALVAYCLLIKKQRSSSSSHYAKHQHNDSCSSTSENCQLEDDDKTFSQVICGGETIEIQQENQQRNCVEVHIETDALLDKHEAAPSFSMSSIDRKRLSDNRCELVENLVLSPILWSVLLENDTMTTEIRAQIERKGATESERNYLFIDYLQKRSHFAFETFIASLIYTKQEHLATMLSQELTAKLKGSTKGQLLAYVRNLSKSSPCHC